MALLKTLSESVGLRLVDVETGEQAILRAEDVPEGIGVSRSIRVGPVEVTFGPTRSDLRKVRDNDSRRRVWVAAPARVRVSDVRLARPVLGPVVTGRTLREFRCRDRAGIDSPVASR